MLKKLFLAHGLIKVLAISLLFIISCESEERVTQALSPSFAFRFKDLTPHVDFSLPYLAPCDSCLDLCFFTQISNHTNTSVYIGHSSCLNISWLTYKDSSNVVQSIETMLAGQKNFSTVLTPEAGSMLKTAFYSASPIKYTGENLYGVGLFYLFAQDTIEFVDRNLKFDAKLNEEYTSKMFRFQYNYTFFCRISSISGFTQITEEEFNANQ